MDKAQEKIHEIICGQELVHHWVCRKVVARIFSAFEELGYRKPLDRPELKKKALEILERFRKLDEIDRTSYQAGINSERNLIDATNEILALYIPKDKPPLLSDNPWYKVRKGSRLGIVQER